MSERGICFFATKNDLHRILKPFEQKHPIKYVECGMYSSKNYPVHNSVDDLRNLGISASGDHNDSSFLIVDSDVEVVLREVRQLLGKKYYVDQKVNHNSIVFWPGGLYGPDYLIHGRIATIHDNEISNDLYKSFAKGFIKGFKKYHSFYIGPEALELSGKVRLITMTINEPPEYDFKINLDN